MPDRVCRVGLTGGLASGKSTVAELLADRGVPVLDADRVVHRLYRPGAAGTAAVLEVFGPEMAAPDGSIDRAALAALAFSDDGARRLLNRVVHPLVRGEVDHWFASLDRGIGVVEAALLVETGARRAYDVLMVVDCRREQQVERALARGLSAPEIDSILAAQAPLAEKVAAADVVVDNSGPRDGLDAEVGRAWFEVLRLCAAHSAAGSNHSVS